MSNSLLCNSKAVITYLSILYTVYIRDYNICFTICSPPQTTFKWWSVEVAESRLWRRSNRTAYSEYCIQYTPLWSQPTRQSVKISVIFWFSILFFFQYQMRFLILKVRPYTCISYGSLFESFIFNTGLRMVRPCMVVQLQKIDFHCLVKWFIWLFHNMF